MPARSDRTVRKPDEVVAHVMSGFHEDLRAHRRFCEKVESRYRSYRAVVEKNSDADSWGSKSFPPYVFQVIETLVAGLLDPHPAWKLQPVPWAGFENVYQAGVRANQTLLAYQLECDRFVEKQRTFALQALITGLTVAKTYWRFQEGVRHQQVEETIPVYDDAGKLIGMDRRLGHEAVETVLHDDPTMEVVDVRDFIWHEAAPSLEKAKRVTHRCWLTVQELRDMVSAHRFNKVRDPGRIDESMLAGEQAEGLNDRDRELFDTSRTKDMVEVLESWIDHGRRRVTIANRTLLLDDRPNRFWHGEHPFVVCSSMPDLFRIPGISDVELIAELQEMLWTLGNQRLDAVQLLNNPVVLFRDDYDDPDSFDFFPGARNQVADPSQVTLWTPPVLENRSIEHEALLKEDLQAIPGASPALLGQLSTGSMTATEVSLTTTLAQRRLANKKLALSNAYARVGEQWISLNQQFINEDRLVPVVGKDGAVSFETISPLLLQGRYRINVEHVDTSLMRQERTAEASARVQVALQIAPVAAALSQTGAAKPLNLDAFVEDWLRAYDITDTERYFTAKPALPQTPAQPQLAPGPPGPPGVNGGVSAPQAYDMNAPSNQFTQSPVGAVQRQGAMAGGPANVAA